MENTELKTVMKMLDKIITSKNKEIKNAFRELMIIAALTESDTSVVGPLTNLISRVEILEKRNPASQNYTGGGGNADVADRDAWGDRLKIK